MTTQRGMQTQRDMLALLEWPAGPVDMVLDTDAYNEIDDQFALAYALLAPEKLRVRAVYAAPFWNEKSSGPEDGMEKSYAEILRVLGLMGRTDLPVLRGSRAFLPDERTPVPSDAAMDLARRAMDYSAENPLYVVAIGAITNVASALLMNPEIAGRIVLIWLGGHALDYPDTKEFNMKQDVAATRVVFGDGVPLVQLPCGGVVDVFRTTGPELAHWLTGKNPLCDYLLQNTVTEAESYAAGKAWSRVIWDVTAVAWLLNDGGRFMRDRLEHKPIPEYDHRYARSGDTALYRYVYRIDRDALFTDLFARLAGCEKTE